MSISSHCHLRGQKEVWVEVVVVVEACWSVSVAFFVEAVKSVTAPEKRELRVRFLVTLTSLGCDAPSC
jgi:hypothetical protein